MELGFRPEKDFPYARIAAKRPIKSLLRNYIGDGAQRNPEKNRRLVILLLRDARFEARRTHAIALSERWPGLVPTEIGPRY